MSHGPAPERGPAASDDPPPTPGFSEAIRWAGAVRLARWARDYPIVSIEDGLAEDDRAGWRLLGSAIDTRVQLIGDDLFATDAARIEQGIAEGIASAVLIKPNQAGSLARTARAFDAARAAGYRTIVSARSGDTEDAWLADIAVGWRAGQIKVGSTTRSERTAEWNRLLRLERSLPDVQLSEPFGRPRRSS